MFEWKRPYRDWRLLVWYPLMVALPLTLFLTPGLDELTGTGKWISVSAFGLMTLLLWRFTRLGIFLKDDQVKIVNMFRSRTLRWNEISAVEDDTEAMERRIVFHTITGEKVKSLVQTITHGGHEVYVTNRQYQQTIEHLQQKVQR